MKTAKSAERDWKARRSGDLYCAPACGGGCTWDEYQSAVKYAKDLVKTLGAGWKADVTENLGWHWGASRDGATISGYPKSYMVIILGKWVAHHRNPRKAFAAALVMAKAELHALTCAVEKLQARKEARRDA